jgi:hypothetical protein
MYTNKKKTEYSQAIEEIVRESVIEKKEKVACGSGANKVAKRSVTLACLVQYLSLELFKFQLAAFRAQTRERRKGSGPKAYHNLTTSQPNEGASVLDKVNCDHQRLS